MIILAKEKLINRSTNKNRDKSKTSHIAYESSGILPYSVLHCRPQIYP